MACRSHLALLLPLFFLLTPSSAWGWGRVGHRVVCEIAYANLSDEARREVDRLIALDPEFERFSESCSWADTPRKRAKEHYLNVPRRFTYVPSAARQGENVVGAIERDRAGLRNRNASDDAKLRHLKFLAHFIGDVHQPLHVSFSDDRGANDIRVRGECSGTLHGAWDGCVLEKALGAEPESIVRALARVRPRKALQSVARWATESLELARDPRLGYCTRRGRTCVYSPTADVYSDGDQKRVVTIDQAYIDWAAPQIQKQLATAGHRLAATLNDAFD